MELLEAISPQTRRQRSPTVSSLKVHLPPAGTVLQGKTLPVRGVTDAGRRVRVNGQELTVDDEGYFGGAVELRPGQATIEVVAADETGRRSVVKRQVEVPKSAWFLMAMSEGVVGSVGSELDGVQDHTHLDFADRVYLHGRAVAWFEGISVVKRS